MTQVPIKPLDFDYKTSYETLLTRMLTTHENRTFEDGAPADGRRYFILRHDIDFCPSAALEMAEIEATHGVSATYFILMSTSLYNILSAEHCTFPRKLISLGHRIGLHYDVAALETVGAASAWEVFRLQLDLLGALSGSRPRVISMHNPSAGGIDPFAGSGEFINAYDARFTKDIVYLSDSCGAWRDEAWDFLQGATLPDRLQLLIHPIFWRHEPADRLSRLEEFIDQRKKELDGIARHTRAMWGAHPAVIEHDGRSARALRA